MGDSQPREIVLHRSTSFTEVVAPIAVKASSSSSNECCLSENTDNSIPVDDVIDAECRRRDVLRAEQHVCILLSSLLAPLTMLSAHDPDVLALQMYLIWRNGVECDTARYWACHHFGSRRFPSVDAATDAITMGMFRMTDLTFCQWVVQMLWADTLEARSLPPQPIFLAGDCGLGTPLMWRANRPHVWISGTRVLCITVERTFQENETATEPIRHQWIVRVDPTHADPFGDKTIWWGLLPNGTVRHMPLIDWGHVLADVWMLRRKRVPAMRTPSPDIGDFASSIAAYVAEIRRIEKRMQQPSARERVALRVFSPCETSLRRFLGV